MGKKSHWINPNTIIQDEEMRRSMEHEISDLERRTHYLERLESFTTEDGVIVANPPYVCAYKMTDIKEQGYNGNEWTTVRFSHAIFDPWGMKSGDYYVLPVTGVYRIACKMTIFEGEPHRPTGNYAVQLRVKGINNSFIRAYLDILRVPWNFTSDVSYFGVQGVMYLYGQKDENINFEYNCWIGLERRFSGYPAECYMSLQMLEEYRNWQEPPAGLANYTPEPPPEEEAQE